MNRTARAVLGLAVLGWVTVGCSDSSNPVGISSPTFEPEGLTLAAVSEIIDFEGIPEGTQNPVVFGDGGSGPIATSAGPANPPLCPDSDTAIIYDTTSGNGGDPDLDVQSAQGNVLVVEEDLADTDGDGDPDDCATGGNLTIDFSGVDAAGVTAESVVVLDIEQPTGESTVDLLGPGDVLITTIDLPFTDDGGIATVDLGSTPGVVKMVFRFVTSGATDDIVFTPPMRGNNGCTPGFWKNNFGQWVTYEPDDDFDTVFGVDAFNPDITLGDAIALKGGKLNALARHAVAALLNAAHGFYPGTEAEVIQFVQDAISSGDDDVIEDAKDLLDFLNNLGCPLDADESSRGGGPRR